MSRFLKEVDNRFVALEQSATIKRAQSVQSRTNWTYDSMPQYEDESQEFVELNIGMRVKHQKFGKGTILSLEASSGGSKIVVNFDLYGRKRLVLPYAKLEIL